MSYDTTQVDMFCEHLDNNNPAFAVTRLIQNIHKPELVVNMLRCVPAILSPGDVTIFNNRLDRQVSGPASANVIREARDELAKEAKKEKEAQERHAMATGLKTTFQIGAAGSNNTSAGTEVLVTSVTPAITGCVIKLGDGIPVDGAPLDIEKVKAATTGASLNGEKFGISAPCETIVDAKALLPEKSDTAPTDKMSEVISELKKLPSNMSLPALHKWPECRVVSNIRVVPGRPDVQSEVDVANNVNDLIATGVKRIVQRDGIYMLVTVDSPASTTTPIVAPAAVPTAASTPTLAPKIEEKSSLIATNITSETGSGAAFQLQLTSNSVLPTPPAVDSVLEHVRATMTRNVLVVQPMLMATHIVELESANDVHRVLSEINSKSPVLYKQTVDSLTALILQGDITSYKTQKQLLILAQAIQKTR